MASSTGSLAFIHRWFPLPFADRESGQAIDHGTVQRMQILLLLLMLCIVPLCGLLLGLFGAMVIGYAGFWLPALIVLIIVTSQISCLAYFLKTGNLGHSSVAYSSIIYILIGLATYYTGGWKSPVCYFILALPALCSLVLTRITAMLFSLAALAMYSIFFLLSRHNIATPQWIMPELLPWMNIVMWLTTMFFLTGSLMLFDISTEDLSLIINDERKRWQKDLEIDDLTNTLNAHTFLEEANKIKSGDRESDTDRAVIYIQINNLKSINQQFGLEAGDHVLKHSAEQLNKNLNIGLTVTGRYSADAFVVYINSINDPGSLISQLFLIKRILQADIGLGNGVNVMANASIGAAITSDAESSIEDLVSLAKEHAMTSSRQPYYRKEAKQ